jgi:hypothetical protein
MFKDALPQSSERRSYDARPADFIAWFLVLLVLAVAAHKGL